MERNKQWVITILCLSMLVYTCRTAQNVVERDSLGRIVVNPVPSPAYLSPKESMKTIYLPKGYHLELVASEPMIKEPVAIVWDGNARMYVAEMLTYMQDADATGEQQPLSRISLLEDTNNDGKMDKSTIFIDSLLLPRMLQCVNNELLVNETNTITIHAYKDSNGDGKADIKRVVYENSKYIVQDANMEHQRSGLDWNLDNWMYMTYEPIRFRYTNGTLKADTIVSGSGGQWGLTHDNYGRLFYSSAGGERPVTAFQINPVYGRLELPDQYSESFQEVWPIIATPDVQGGLRRLSPNNTLNHITGACGQSIYRGDGLPQDLVGDYIVCEPVARIVRRAEVIQHEGKTMLENVYNQQEFIASSDMNFRPVNSATGPDGTLYIVDMYRGIIQQGNWTKPGSFLRNKIDSIGLAKNTGRGRIYRVVHDGFKQPDKPRMLNETSSKLISYLDHPNGWWRDNAQKQIVLNGDRSVVPKLKQMAVDQNISHLGVLHALWTLEGLGALDKDVVLMALKHENAQIRKAAVWISERYLKTNDEQVIAAVSKLQNDRTDDVRVQLLLSLFSNKSKPGNALINQLIIQNKDNEMMMATKKALDKNEDVRNFGMRLANLDIQDRNMILSGAATFKSVCASCHGPDGKGIGSSNQLTAPSLVNSKRLTLPEANTTIRILLKGLGGPIDGNTYSSIMPPMEANNDNWVASVASYIRYEFGGTARLNGIPISPVVKPETVKKIREAYVKRSKVWTLDELEAIRNGEAAKNQLR
ncbi:c-type cytochrome [Daejeonella sp.]|uniref:DUF7133 domain-containing protein n=1 Tax=Daejeonella sp. TaxID=2805397 RepID=UPI0030C4F21D